MEENRDLKEEYKRQGMIYVIVGLIEMALWGILYGAFIGGPVIILGILGIREAEILKFDGAKKRFLIAKIVAIIGGALWAIYMIGLFVLCYIINH